MPALIAGAVLLGCAVLGIATLTKAIPKSYASMPAGSAGTGTGALQFGSAGPDDESGPASAATLTATSQRAAHRARCPECGVVESIVELVPYADIGELKKVSVNIDDDTKSAAGDRARVPLARRFAMTVRFRDGTTTVFHEATARNWHPGVRVILIAGVTAATR